MLDALLDLQKKDRNLLKFTSYLFCKSQEIQIVEHNKSIFYTTLREIYVLVLLLLGFEGLQNIQSLRKVFDK